MKITKATVKDFEHIERNFFDIDESTGEAIVRLHFAKPSDVFDNNCLSKVPIFNDDFDDWLRASFDLIPSKYQIALKISFDDMEGYSPAELHGFFVKNLMLSARTHLQSVRRRDRIAYRLIGAGLLSFVGMMLIGRLWVTESFWHDVFFYFLDIVTTVLFWEAAGILFVENREHRATVREYRERFSSIEFECGGGDQ